MMSTLEGVLNRSKPRHDGTDCDCLHGRSTFRLVEAYQVKNRKLWRRYQRHVRSIVDKHKQHGIKPRVIDPPVGDALTRFPQEIQLDLAGNEILLFHGTREFDKAKDIAKEGFDNRIARSGGLYGSGTYFAAQTCKSAQYATINGVTGKASAHLIGTMLVARVAIGDPHYASVPCRNLTRPPTKSAHEIRYDSIIAKPGIPNGQSNGVQAHMEFVTFAPEQAYPEYILRFTEE
ncbi:Poly [ADP-ribose] polymerase tankyrase (dTNKS) (Poly [ADP-ribose] polymerase) (Protein poly-ADP-ribosyltransferase tankyrase) [Durusdinium trenchii]|uniref:Poly [ADP-ribose] polymerase n=1 Tax=Durusdinium trenchii TaxID=1381693 RepID=A0ABP0I8Q1_9DINO